jgi:hypothetical protein
MIVRGEIGAIDVAPPGHGGPRYVILPAHLDAYIRGHEVSPTPKPARRPKRPYETDYYPD